MGGGKFRKIEIRNLAIVILQRQTAGEIPDPHAGHSMKNHRSVSAR